MGIRASGISIWTAGGLVQGNYIGTNASGTAALGNDVAGVIVSEGSNTTIGGTASEARNIISGNAGNGVLVQVVEGPTLNTIIQGNYIGIDVKGVLPCLNHPLHLGVSAVISSVIARAP